MNSVLDKLFRSKGESTHYELYKLLSLYDTETLLFMMAKANNRTIKRRISTFFTAVERSKSHDDRTGLEANGIPARPSVPTNSGCPPGGQAQQPGEHQRG